MSMTPAQASIRFYEWSLREMENEYAHDFPFVKRFADAGAGPFLDIIREVPEDKRHEFVVALVRRCHSDALELLGNNMSEDDLQWRSYYLERLQLLRWTTPKIPHSPALQPAPFLTPKQFWRTIKESSIEIIKEQNISRRYDLIDLECRRDGVNIRTTIDIGGRSQHVSFHHNLDPPPIGQAGNTLIRRTNALTWLGIGQARWNYARPEYAPAILELIAASLERFFSAADFILKGEEGERKPEVDKV